MENSKLQIVRNNMNLTPNEIKKKLRKTYIIKQWKTITYMY